MNNRKRKIHKHVILSVTLLTIGVVLFIILKSSLFGYAEVAAINGNGIVVKELESEMSRNKGEVFSYFSNKYSIADSHDFWEKNFDGEVPEETLRKRSLDECIRKKMVLIMAKEKGLVKDTGYKAFIGNMKTENKERAKSINQGKVIFGLKEFDVQTYTYYYYSNLERELKDALVKSGELTVNDQEIEKHYEEIKDIYYQEGIEVKVKAICFSGKNEDGTVNKDNASIREKAKKAKERIDNGEDFDDAAEKYGQEDFGDDGVYVFSNETAKNDAKLWPALREMALSLNIGEVSDVIEDGSNFYIIKCIDKGFRGYTDYEEVKDNIETILIDNKFKELIDENIEKSDIRINQFIYSKLKVQ